MCLDVDMFVAIKVDTNSSQEPFEEFDKTIPFHTSLRTEWNVGLFVHQDTVSFTMQVWAMRLS